MTKSNISWTDWSWNPYDWHCTPLSPGCKNCYARAFAERLGKTFVGKPNWRGAKAWLELKKIPSGSAVFVNSFSDTYHEDVPGEWIHAIHNAAAYNRPDLTFLLLTKRPERAYAMRHTLAWPENLWIGTSVESAEYLWRLDYLLEIPAAGHFLSAEPLLGSLAGLEKYLSVAFGRYQPGYEHTPANWKHINHRPKQCLDWTIVGGESGAVRRPFQTAWAEEIRDMCQEAGTSFYFKQGSGFKPGQNRLLDGREWNETPFTLLKHEPTAAPVQLALL